MDTKTLTLLAGIMFGIWPLLMNRTGLSGFQSAAVFAGVAFLTILPFAFFYGDGWHVQGAAWKLAIIAGVLGAGGLVCFNTMLAKADPTKVGPLIVAMILMQTVVPAAYHVITTGDVSPRRLIGAVAAVAAIKLLT